MAMTTKELVLTCAGNIKALLDIKETDTLAEVRIQIDEELDDDLIVPDFAFHVNGARISAKQERKKLAWRLLDKEVSLKSKRRRPVEEATDEVTIPPPKRSKRDDAGTASVDSMDVEPSNGVNTALVTPRLSNERNSCTSDGVPEQRKVSDVEASDVEAEEGGLAIKRKSLEMEFKKVTNDDGGARSAQRDSGSDKDSSDKAPTTEADDVSQDQSNDTSCATDEVSTPPPCNKPSNIAVEATTEAYGTAESGGDVASESSSSSTKGTLETSNTSSTASPSQKDIDAASADVMSCTTVSASDKPGGTDEDDVGFESALDDVVMSSKESTEEEFLSFGTARDDSVTSDVNMEDARMVVEGREESTEEDVSSGASHDDDTSSAGTVDLINTVEENFASTIASVEDMPVGKNGPSKPGEIIGKELLGDNAIDFDCDEVTQKSCSVLASLSTMLKNNPLFCSKDRRDEWSKEITDLLEKSAPKSTVGVLGNTGVGKSSLLNALLEEASVLPTSGSRGCTAAVVELRFNAELEKTSEGESEVSCYRGEVEFMTLQEWKTELKVLVDECSTQEKFIYAREPDPQKAAEAAAAWAKIDQVYGRGTMARYKGKQNSGVFGRLASDSRVKRLLTPEQNSGHPYNVITVSEGLVVPGSKDAKLLLSSFEDMNIRMRRSKKKWAQAFRSKINSYVYRKGNGSEPQTWPLIRKVVLHGPWACLSTGACLVDLPGVRDANAARAKVSEHYLQNCDQIWVVAPIKRAVDDGTAKELLGEQFKRRLLMDGQYGNVSFICTQTDDCEATEIMRDHSDVAQNVPGRWEEMTEFSNKISDMELELSKLNQEEEGMKEEWEDADQLVKDMEEELQDLQDDLDSEREEELENARKEADAILHKLSDWKEKNAPRMDKVQSECEVEQRKLKTLCALVRNEYSTKCLQNDFRAGLKELYRSEEDDGDDSNQEHTDMALPDDFDMDVYCISSNDYLKIQGIKPKSDGAANTFADPNHTGIPDLRKFVHEITKRHRLTFAKGFVNKASDMMDRFKLLAIGAAKIPEGRSSLHCMRMFEKEVRKISDKIDPLAKDFQQKMQQKVKARLEPALKAGARKGIMAAMPIVDSWGSKSRRNRHFRNPENNGLYYSTYNATCRRGGVFASPTAGPIDLNQELCDPMEKEFSVDWQRTLDSALRVHLGEAENKVQKICDTINEVIKSSFEEEGMDKVRLTNMGITANRSCINAVKIAFAAMRSVATEMQRNLNRSLLPLVQENMEDSYNACLNVQRGTGTFNRMKRAMNMSTSRKVGSMYQQSELNLLKGIDELVSQLVDLIGQTSQTITKHLEDVYSIYWDDQSDKSNMIDPEMQRKIRECRDNLLPDLNNLCSDLGRIQALVGIEREDLDLDVTAVEDVIQRKIDNAVDKGEIIDLCDSDDEIEDVLSRLPPARTNSLRQLKVKEEPDFDVLM